MDSDGIELADKNGATQGAGVTIAHTITAQFSTLNASESATRLKTSLTHGLSPAEAETRLRQYGPNELQHEEPEPLWLRFLGQFKEPLILLLLGSATISFFMRNFDDAISITIAVTIVVTVGFVQEYRSEKSLEALNKLVPHSSHLIRGGNFAARRTDQAEEARLMEGDKAVNEKLAISAPATQLVPGDLVIFSTGDRIPADIRITNAADLFIDESNLTGETEPVHKVSEVDQANGSYEPKTPATGTPRLVDQHNIAFMGTLVRGGHGQGIVIATGAETEFGQISASLSAIESPRTPLQQSMDRLGKDLSYMSFGVIGLIVVIGLIRGLPLLEMFQIGVSLAVAAIPEGLPIIVTVTLALGVLRMAKRGAIVRRLPSVETLGSVNVLCSDKTGTLTMNHMTVTKLWHIDADKPVEVGKDIASSDAAIKTIIRVGNIANNSRLSGNDKTSGANSQLLSSLDASETETLQQSRWTGQPTDVAMMDLLDKTGDHDIRERLGQRIAEVPFSSARKWMGVIHQTEQSNGNRASETAYLKGAYERVLPRCDTYISKDGREIVLDEAKKKSIAQAADTLAEEGLRIIAFATGSIRERKSGVNHEDIYQGLTFIGLAGMNDPPRKGVERSIRRLMVGGVKVIMITGDSEKTALAIANKIGMPVSASTAGGQGTRNTVLRGSQLDAMSTADLASVMNSVSIFARTSPEHKMKIISALQSRGDIVAMTGDGVNDAPALKKADIGISMGVLGTDVAKEAADMILTDDNLSTILNAIEEGKGIFYNIQNFITFQLSTSVAALLLVLLSTLFRLPSPLNAMQILWINILMDGPPAQSLGVEPVDHAVMSRPPRPRTARVLTRRLLQRVGTSALIITAGTMLTYVSVMDSDGTVTARDTTMTFTCFVFFDMFNALSCRSEGKSVLRGELQVAGNKMFNYAVGGSLLGQMAVIYLPPLQRVFQTEALGLYDLLTLIALTSLVFWADEGRKLWRSRRRKWTSGYSRAV